MNALLILVVIAAIFIWAWRVATYYTDNSPVESNCNQNCNQGRDCDCMKVSVDDTWPFPNSKP